eukprot:6201952-Pleurochrysis_carterae.AAC.3
MGQSICIAVSVSVRSHPRLRLHSRQTGLWSLASARSRSVVVGQNTPLRCERAAQRRRSPR